VDRHKVHIRKKLSDVGLFDLKKNDIIREEETAL